MLAATFLWVIFGLKGCYNISVVTKKAGDQSFIEEVSAIPGGEGVRLCVQYSSCTGSWPNAIEMDYPPRQIIDMVHAGMLDDDVCSNSTWQSR